MKNNKFWVIIVYLLVLFYPFVYLQFVWGEINIPYTDVLALLLLPYVIYLAFKRKGLNFKLNFPGFIFYFLWIASGAVSLLNVPFEFDYSVKYFFRPLAFFYLMYVIVPWQIIRDKKILENIFRIFFGLGVFVSIMGLIYYGQRLYILFDSVVAFLTVRARPIAIFGIYPLGTNHNQLAEILVAVIPFSLLLFWRAKKGYKKNLIFIAICLMVVVTLFTFSRSGWIALMLEALLMFFLLYRSHYKKIINYSFLFLIFLAPLFVYMFFFGQQSFVESSTKVRADIVKMAVEVFRDHPYIGNGPGILKKILQKDKFYRMEYGSYAEAHGYLQQILAEQGLFGIITFFGLVGFIIFKIIKSYQKFRADPYWGKILVMALVSTMGSMAFQLFQTSYFYSKLWVPLGISLMCALLAEKYGQKSYSHN